MSGAEGARYLYCTVSSEAVMLAQPQVQAPAAPIACGLADGRGAPAADLGSIFTTYGKRLTFARGEEIFGQGEPANIVYRVVSGAVRTLRILNDGRRQISDFHVAGDIFGLEAGAEHRLGAEAIGCVVLLAVRRRTLAERAAEDRGLAALIWSLTIGDLQRTQDHLMLLGRQTATERVCAFLLALAERDTGAVSIDLPMSRQDIADYLGLTIETVSRTFTQLQGSGWIRLLSTRCLELKNPGALRRVCG